MDPTMQSPVRLPLSAPLDLEVPSGPHFYPIRAWVGSVSQGNTPQQAFEALLRHATPFQRSISVDGGQIAIPGLGRVKQIVDPDRMIVVNTTLPDHLLHPGNVHRRIVQEGDNIYVVTHGYGTGILPQTNERLAKGGWALTHDSIRRELNPFGLLGYPMDEMNAIDGAPPTAPRRLRGLVSNEPMDFTIQLPIFSP